MPNGYADGERVQSVEILTSYAIVAISGWEHLE